MRAVLSDAGSALMGVGASSGEDRAASAARKAIASPLLESSIEGARGLLLTIAGNAHMGLLEVTQAAEVIGGVSHEDANIIFGTVIDESLGESMRVTVIAAGFDRWDDSSPRREDSSRLGAPQPARSVRRVRRSRRRARRRVWTWTSRRSSGDPGPPVLALTLELNGARRAEIRFSDRRQGDLGEASRAAQRASLAGGRWTRLRQQHGADVVTVTAPGEADGAAADAAVTATSDCAVLTVRTADCAPLALVATEGVVAAVHAGWRGLAAGVVEEATATVRRLGGRHIRAFVGPCIHPGVLRVRASTPGGTRCRRLGP